MWVQLLIPRIEDGNNFGVSIQEETVAELRTVEGEAASYLDQISRFLWTCLHLFFFVCFKRLDLRYFIALTCHHLKCLSSLFPDITSQGQSWFLK